MDLIGVLALLAALAAFGCFLSARDMAREAQALDESDRQPLVALLLENRAYRWRGYAILFAGAASPLSVAWITLLVTS